MATPWIFLTHKSDSWIVKLEKKLGAWLWNDLSKPPEPDKDYPNK